MIVNIFMHHKVLSDNPPDHIAILEFLVVITNKPMKFFFFGC